MSKENNDKEFNEILYRIKHILGTVPKYIEGCTSLICFLIDHSNYKGDFINDVVNKLVIQYHNKYKPKFNWE